MSDAFSLSLLICVLSVDLCISLCSLYVSDAVTRCTRALVGVECDRGGGPRCFRSTGRQERENPGDLSLRPREARSQADTPGTHFR